MANINFSAVRPIDIGGAFASNQQYSRRRRLERQSEEDRKRKLEYDKQDRAYLNNIVKPYREEKREAWRKEQERTQNVLNPRADETYKTNKAQNESTNAFLNDQRARTKKKWASADHEGIVGKAGKYLAATIASASPNLASHENLLQNFQLTEAHKKAGLTEKDIPLIVSQAQGLLSDYNKRTIEAMKNSDVLLKGATREVIAAQSPDELNQIHAKLNKEIPYLKKNNLPTNITPENFQDMKKRSITLMNATGLNLQQLYKVIGVSPQLSDKELNTVSKELQSAYIARAKLMQKQDELKAFNKNAKNSPELDSALGNIEKRIQFLESKMPQQQNNAIVSQGTKIVGDPERGRLLKERLANPLNRMQPAHSNALLQ